MDIPTLSTGHSITFLLSVNALGKVNFYYPYYQFIREPNYFFGFENNIENYPTVKVKPIIEGYLIATYLDLPGSKLCMQLIKTDLQGKLLWEKKMSGLGSALLNDMLVQEDSSIILTGSTSDKRINYAYPELFYCLKNMVVILDKNGTVLKENYFGSDGNVNMAKCLQKFADGSFSLAGYTCLSSSAFDKMYWIRLTGSFDINRK